MSSAAGTILASRSASQDIGSLEADSIRKKATGDGGSILLALLDFEGPLAYLLCFLTSPELVRVALIAADSPMRWRLQNWPELWALSLADQPALLTQVASCFSS
jgi:hypothetical protein